MTSPGTLTAEEVEAPQQFPLRRLPLLVADAVRLCWAAGPHELALFLALHAFAGLGLVLPILGGRELLTQMMEDGESIEPALVFRGAVLLAVLGAVNAATTVATARGRILAERLNQHGVRRVLEVARTVPLEQFESPAFHNRLQRASTSAEFRHNQLAEGLNAVFQAILATVGVSAALGAIEPVLMLLVLVAVMPLWLAGIRSGQALFAMASRMTPVERERNYLVQVLTDRRSVKEVRAYGLGSYLAARWDRRSAERLAETYRTVRELLRITLGASLLTAVVLGGTLGAVAWLAVTGRLSVSEAGATTGAVLVLVSRLRGGAMGADLLFEAAPFVADLHSFLDHEDEGSPVARPVITAGFSRLSVEDLTFTYPSSSRPALRGVDMDIHAGQVVALVGENGSGKTTLAKLLCHLYRPQQGRIRYDGVDVSDGDPAALQDGIAVLFQDFQRYLLSASENIGLGRHTRLPDDAAVGAAATAAGADKFLARLPTGYATLLGPEFDGGTELSGGQWQRVAVARAFFRDAPFVILDEPTASLDARAEHALFEQIQALLAGRTVLLISHRFSTVRSADHIYVLAEGRIAEHGTHDELMAHGGRYAEMFTLQAEPYVDRGLSTPGGTGR